MTEAQTIKAVFKGGVGSFHIDLNFTIPCKGVTALFGASGSGKTSILRAVSGLEKLEGRLQVGAEIWQDDAENIFLPPHERAIGYVFQEASLFPHLTVEKNLRYGLKRARARSTENAPDFAAIVELLRLEKFLTRSPLTLSGGERQRVAIGRALLAAPKLLLMDEPLAALDGKSKKDVLTSLEKLHHALSLPILYVSHDSGEVARLADHMVLIAAGKKQAEGAARDLFERLDITPPDGRFETSVVITGTVKATDATNLTCLSLGNQNISIPSTNAPEGTTLSLRIRARDVALATKRPEAISIRNILAGTIIGMHQEKGAPFTEILVDIDGNHIRSQVTADAVTDLGLSEGQQVFALVKSVTVEDFPAV